MSRSIANIRSLKGLGIFADRARGSAAVPFRRYNLIYGFNGSGKSTLSRLFSSLEAGAMHERLPADATFEVELDDGAVLGCPTNPNGLERQIVVFNSDYIDRNLQWASGVANPVFFIGADQAEAAGVLSKLEASISQQTVIKERASTSQSAASKVFANFKKERARLTAARLHLGNRKYEAPALAKDYEAWKGGDAVRISDKELDAAEEVRKLSEPMPGLTVLEFDISSVEAAHHFVTEMCSQSLTTVALEEIERFPDILLWLKEGHEFHRKHELKNCLYCGNEIQGDRIALLTSALDGQVDEFVSKIERTMARLNAAIVTTSGLRKAVPSSDELSSDVRPDFRRASGELVGDLDGVENHFLALKAVLELKRQRPASPADTSSLPSINDVGELARSMAESLRALNSIVTDHNQKVADFADHRQRAEIAIRKHYVADCAVDYDRHQTELEAAQTALASAEQKLERLTAEAEELRGQIRKHGPAAEVINKLVASYLGHGELTILPVDQGYQFRRHGKDIQGTPSEGEKTAIALAYFLSSIEADGRKLKDTIVVIDDPVSSLDTKALNYACSLVRSRLNDAGQLIVLTHNLQCMNEFRKAWKGRVRPQKGDPTGSFLFIDTSIPEGSDKRVSKIVEMSKLLREYDSEYHFLFNHVLKFTGDATAYYEYGYMMPNVLRRVLDVFLAFRCPGNSGFAEQVKRLCDDFPDLDRDRLAALERLVQVESHSDNLDDLLSFSSMTIEETKAAADALVAMMEQVDGKHLAGLRRLCR